MIHQNLIQKYLKKWYLTLTTDAINSTSGLIFFVQFQDKPAVLKIFLKEDKKQQAMALQHYKKQGAIQLLRQGQSAILMKRAIPGTCLKTLTMREEDQKATDIFCNILQKLSFKKQKFTENFPSIIDWGAGSKTSAPVGGF